MSQVLSLTQPRGAMKFLQNLKMADHQTTIAGKCRTWKTADLFRHFRGLIFSAVGLRLPRGLDVRAYRTKERTAADDDLRSLTTMTTLHTHNTQHFVQDYSFLSKRKTCFAFLFLSKVKEDLLQVQF